MKYFSFIYTLLLMVNTCDSHLFTKHQETKVHQLETQESDQQRNLSSSSSCSEGTKCLNCQYGSCLQCASNRVIPGCDCAFGYVDVGGVCTQCPLNCKQCSDPSTCTGCYSQYALSNGQCTCSTQLTGTYCNDLQNLYYNSEVAPDMQSIIISFSAPIRIASVFIEGNQFQQLVTNCQILDSETLTNFGINLLNTNDNTQGCYINQYQQNQFIIFPGPSLIQSNVLIPPVILTTNLQRWNNNELVSVPQAITDDITIARQLNQIQQVCYFSNPQMQVTRTNYVITTLSPYQNLQPITFDANCQTISTTSTSPNLSSLWSVSVCQTQYFYVDYTNFSIGDSLIAQMTCTGLYGFTTSDQITLTFMGTVDNIVLTPQNVPKMYLLNQDYQNTLSLHHSTLIFNDLIVTVSTYPQVITPFTFTPTSFSQQITIPKYSVKTPTPVILTINVVTTDGKLQAVQHLSIWYQNSFQVTVPSNAISNIDPSKAIQLSQTVVDSNQAATLSSQFDYSWACFYLSFNPCYNLDGLEVSISSTDQQVGLTTLLPYNFVGYIAAIAARKSQQNAQQYSLITISTYTVSLIVSSTTPASINLMNLYDLFQIDLSLQTNMPQPSIPNYNTTVTISYDSSQKIISSNGNVISICLQDYFPVVSFSSSSTPQISLFFTIAGSPLIYPISIDSEVLVSIRQPPSGCSISQGNQSIIAFQTTAQFTVNNCVLNGDTFNYQFFYYINQQEMQEEIITPTIINRIELSTSSTVISLSTMLPPGNLILMVILNGSNNLMANFTLPVTVLDNNFSQQAYEQFILDQYGSDLGLSSQESEILGFQIISLAIQYYESQNTKYSPSSQINDIKNSMLTSLQDNSWSALTNDIYLMSQQVLNRIVTSKISMSASAEQALKAQNEQEIANLLAQISSINPSQMTSAQRTFFQQILAGTIQNFLQSLSNQNSWSSSDCSNAIQQLTSALNGIGLTMLVNQAAIVLKTQGPILQVENIDFKTVMSKYFDTTNPLSPTSDQLQQNYYFQIQTYPDTHPLYRDELQSINQPYPVNATSDQLSLLQKTYPIIIPKIQISQNSQLTNVEMSTPIIIPFGPSDNSNNLKCIQRSSSGGWVSQNCQLITTQINSQNIISCKCKSPGITSIIADIVSIANNKNINDIVSSDGLMRLIGLANWYEYAPIWIIVVLNIILVILLFTGRKLDLKDQQNDTKRQFLANRFKCLSEVESTPRTQVDQKESVFMQVKNKRQSQREESADSILKFQQKRSDSLDSPINLVNDNKQQNKVKSIFAKQFLNHNDNNNLDTEEIEFSQQKSIFGEMKDHGDQLSNQNKSNEVNLQDINLMLSPTLGPFLPTEQPDDKDQHIILFDEIFENQTEQEDNTEQNCNDRKEKDNEAFQHEKKFEERQDSKGIDDKNTIKDIEQQCRHPLNIDALKLDADQQDKVRQENKKDNYSQEQSIKEVYNQESIIKTNQEQPNFDRKEQNIDNNCNQQKVDLETPLDQNNHYSNINFTIAQSQISKADTFQIQQNQDINTNSDNQNNTTLNITQQIIKTTKVQPSKEEKMKQKQMKEEKKKKKQKDAKQSLEEYLQSEKKIKAIFAFHIFISTFIVYNRKLSRILRFIIYYNKMIWLLTINSIFGQQLSVVQVVIISLISTVVLNLLTIFLISIFSNKKLKVFGVLLSFLFLLLCYYSILVVVSGQDSSEANMWIISYIATLVINEYVIGIPTCIFYYEILKRYICKINQNIILQLLGASILLKAFLS